MRFLAVCGICLLIVLSSSSKFAGAAQFGSIGGRPGQPNPDNPRSQSIFVHTLTANEKATDVVEVDNYTDERKTLLIYATDSIISSGGAFGCAQMVDEKKHVGGWITLDRNEVTLEPQTNTFIDFTIQMPSKVDVGENDGCIVIQEKDAAPQNIPGQTGSGSISLSFRTAIRVAIEVPGEIIKKLTIVDYRVTRNETGNFILKPSVKNEGNVSIDAQITPRSVYLWGTELKTETQQYPILKGATSEWNFELKRPFWGGFYRSKFTATYDSNPKNRLGVTTNQELFTLHSKTIIFFAWPTLWALLILLLIFVTITLIVWLLVRRIREKRRVAKTWVDHQMVSTVDIKTLAESHGVSWKLIAKTNKLKAPYGLKAGDVVKLPPKALKQKSKKQK